MAIILSLETAGKPNPQVSFLEKVHHLEWLPKKAKRLHDFAHWNFFCLLFLKYN
jgi:hypothetical protein